MTLLIQYTLIFASVLMLVALGGCFAERSGVINIGLEGIMVIGALGGALVLKFMPVSVGAPVMVITTVIVSALFGMVFSLLLAVAAINFKADQTITGTAMNMLATAAATVAVLAVLTFGILAIFNRVTNRVIAPDVEGYPAEEAMAMARRAGLGWQQTEQNSDLIPAGVVISQLPEPDTEMSRGDSLLATVSLGPSQDTIPDCVGQLYDNISKNLRKQGFSIVVIRSVSTEPLGTILQQNPKGGEAFTPGQELELSISGGSTLVPDVTARTEEEAAKLLRENQLSVGETVYVEVLDESQIGMVMAQNPVSGTLAVMDAPVVLTVATKSKGYKGEISFTMEKADQDRTIRVTLVENGQEVEQYSAVYLAGQSGSVITPLSSAYGGSASCRVYVDGKLYLEQPVTME